MPYSFEPQDRNSFLSHFTGIVYGLIYLIYILFNHQKVSTASLVGLIIFATSMILLYAASSFYHYLSDSHPFKLTARKIDHSMIYFLIAGSYTPVCLTYMAFDKALVFVNVLFAIAFLGIFLKVFWIHAPRFVSTLLYLIMGWALLFDIPAFSSVPTALLYFLAAGGISYSIGAIIYIIKKPKISGLSFHDIFHYFILFGTIIQSIGYILCIIG
ncbi:MAG: hemolysin III family protein [Erysipelotrichaceae bacterium]